MFLPTTRKSPSPAARRAAARRPALTCAPLDERAVPAVLTVDLDGGRQYTSIGAAVAAASNSDTIDVYGSASPYVEVVNITKTGLKLVAKESNVNLTSPATVTPDTVAGFNLGDALIDIRSKNVVVDGFKLDGSTNTDGNLYSGIRVVGTGSATIKNNTVTGLLNPGDTGSWGIGIQVGTGRGTGSAGTAKVTNNTVTNYYGAGVLVDGSGGSADVKSNTITGRGAANGGVAQYGVQVSRGATARVEKNTVTGNQVGGDPFVANSAGIYFFDDGGKKSVAAKNTVSGNDIGIFVEASNGTSNGAIDIVNNDVTGNTGYAGIYVSGSNNVDVENNDVFSNTAIIGIALEASNSVDVESNCVRDNAAADGIYVYQGANNSIKCNAVTDNGFNGIVLDASSDNAVWNNFTADNAQNGIAVFGGTGNDLWLGASVNNVLDGILLEDTTCTTVVGNALLCNGGYGLRLVNADNTFIALNLISGNGEGSIYIDADSTGTVSIANWTDTPPEQEGDAGSLGLSAAYTSAAADSDADVADLED